MKQALVWMGIAVLLLGLTACAGNKELQKKKAEASRNLGKAYLNEGKYSAALKELLNAEKLYPRDHILQYYLGIAYRAKGKPDLAIKHFKKAIALKPGFAAAINNLGTAYFDKGDWDAAIACFKKVSEDLLYGTPHFAYYNLGRAYFMKKDYPLAEEYFLKALEMEPRFVEPLVELGRTYMAVGRNSEALAAFQSAVEQSPDSARAYFYLAEVRRVFGEYTKALEAFCFVRLNAFQKKSMTARKLLLRVR